MKTTYTINRDDLRPPAKNTELALFTCAMQPEALRDWLATQEIAVPPQFALTHNTGTDDPPDLSALGLGWECTEFPPNQTALRKVHLESGPMGMVVPGFSETGADIRKIREQSIPYTSYPRFVSLEDEIVALENAFLNKVIGGPKSKDVPGNDVLLLDRRADHAGDLAETALRRALAKTKPKHIRLVLLVGFKHYVRDVIPDVAKLFP